MRKSRQTHEARLSEEIMKQKQIRQPEAKEAATGGKTNLV